MTTVGIIYPDHAAEDDYPRAERMLGVRLPVTHVYGTDLHAVPELTELGSPERLAGGAAALANEGLDSIVWACTSGSFVRGLDGAQAQVDRLAAESGVPATSTSLAFAAAAHALGVRTVAVAASYPESVAALFVDYLTASGLTVASLSSAGITTAAEVGTLAPSEVVRLAASNDHPDADAVLIPDTAMRTLEAIPELERGLGKPVLTANQVTVWHGLAVAGAAVRHPLLGALFAEEASHGAS